MRFLVAGFFLLVSVWAYGIEQHDNSGDSKVLRQQGRLFTVQLVLGEPLRFFVVGREEAKVDLNDLTLTVRRLKPYPGKVISLDRQNDYFVTSEPNELQDATALEVTAKTKAKVDKIHFKIENRRP